MVPSPQPPSWAVWGSIWNEGGYRTNLPPWADSTSPKRFPWKVRKLSHAVSDLGNPFQEDSQHLLSTDTKDITDPSAAELISTHHERDRTHFQEFMEGLALEKVTTFFETIKKNKVDFLFSQQPALVDATKQKMLKEDCQLFSKLFISCQSRERDLQEFFRHENQQFPASLSEAGKLYTCQKSQLAAILESHVGIPDTEPEADTIIIDGSALVNSLLPRLSRTMQCWWCSQPYSTRERTLCLISTSHQVWRQRGRVWRQPMDGLAPCSHEEADKCIFLHARNAAEEGSKVLMVKANDTDVLVITISVLPALQETGLQPLWAAFEQGQNLRWIPGHDHHSIGLQKSKGIFFFHAFTGCDVVSGFCGKGKKSAWQTWDE